MCTRWRRFLLVLAAWLPHLFVPNTASKKHHHSYSKSDKQRPAAPRYHTKEESPVGCSRAVSRWVRAALHEYIVPQAKKVVGFKWPPKCGMDPDHDYYHYQESQKVKLKSGHYQCSLCKKLFRTEYYIDVHMDTRHPDSINNATHCLADLCEVFDVCNGPPHRRRKPTSVCDEHKLEAAHELCDREVTRCFPLSSTARLLHVDVRRRYCSHLNCKDWLERHRSLHQETSHTVVVAVAVIVMVVVLGFVAMCLLQVGEPVDEDVHGSQRAHQQQKQQFRTFKEIVGRQRKTKPI
ncbi:unnamed protein product [Vitrella brassicaformis CCMP3155]|uniref:C2H2-type domain-containing protein n=2 Tax=Vitrella brassicaformis TaxID=1169539 RepID=A0A0G4FK76_VITBC|nr:unnamed protein product [Vitrella brassicaformis CCMP3155]|mmetsp:Transcript_1700/g.3697  ORF Transcript_1700/g.3697 Transcript_1700/m.3697 type:complete len:293 (+) Transcript_1700:109-987(+)|eukprot:CEM13784.1 unnamed protein product [Vitrella brassicaformis CCMP3155]